MLEVSVISSETSHSFFQISSDIIETGKYYNSDLYDISQLHGISIILRFELYSDNEGAEVMIRNLTFWKDRWNGNEPPIAEAGPDQIALATCDGISTIALDGSASFDPDEGEDELQLWWMLENGLLATGFQPTVELPIGTHTITLVVRDMADHASTDEVAITINPDNCPFKRGDSNIDAQVDISDAINILGFLFVGTGKIPCQDSADANDDGNIDISDAIYILSFLFTGQKPEPKDPFRTLGPDPTPDNLGCNQY